MAPETVLELVDRLGMPAIVLIALALGARAVWRFVVKQAWPEWMDVQRERLSEQKKILASVSELQVLVTTQSERVERLFWSCLEREGEEGT